MLRFTPFFKLSTDLLCRNFVNLIPWSRSTKFVEHGAQCFSMNGTLGSVAPAWSRVDGLLVVRTPQCSSASHWMEITKDPESAKEEMSWWGVLVTWLPLGFLPGAAGDDWSQRCMRTIEPIPQHHWWEPCLVVGKDTYGGSLRYNTIYLLLH